MCVKHDNSYRYRLKKIYKKIKFFLISQVKIRKNR